jgi:hypothetical protein
VTGQPYEIDLTRTARRALAERLPSKDSNQSIMNVCKVLWIRGGQVIRQRQQPLNQPIG